MSKVKALIISGYGINCEKELAIACEIAGAQAQIAHAHHFLTGHVCLDEFQLLMFPGGFSFGDELGAGKVFANRLSYSSHAVSLGQRLRSFVANGNAILGICNGFQLLIKLGLLPGLDPSQLQQHASLAYNDIGRFENRWVHHKIGATPCIFTQDIQEIYLPVRHGEGKFVVGSDAVLQKLISNNQIALQYATEDGAVTDHFPHNPNGSVHSIAGVCDPTGRILGMMAHPEAALFFTNHPKWTRIKDSLRREGKSIPTYGAGLTLFKNAVEYMEKNR